MAQSLVPTMMMERGDESIATIGYVSAAVSLIGFAGTCCLVAAVFTGRQDPRPT